MLEVYVIRKYYKNQILRFRIDKDVQRCDRNMSYFSDKNLEKLRNVITTYVWENLDIGYMQVEKNQSLKQGFPWEFDTLKFLR